MLSSLFRDESEHARAIPLCFLPKGRHLIEYDPKVYTPVLLTVDNSGFLNPMERNFLPYISDRGSRRIFNLSR
jgi:hypothetical protein